MSKIDEIQKRFHERNVKKRILLKASKNSARNRELLWEIYKKKEEEERKRYSFNGYRAYVNCLNDIRSIIGLNEIG